MRAMTEQATFARVPASANVRFQTSTTGCFLMPEQVHAIYRPPRSELPYLVVTLDVSSVSVIPAKTIVEARSKVAKLSLRARGRSDEEAKQLAHAV
jgi:hypothetical protein